MSGRRLARVLCVLAATAALTTATAGEPPQNDAGTATDASNLRSAPTMLATMGSFDGSIRSHDSDWYGFATATTGPWCSQSSASGETYSWVWLGLRTSTGIDRGVAMLVTNASALAPHVAIAGSGIAQTYVGIDPVLNPATNAAARPGPYAFSISGSAPSGGADAGTGTDAGSILHGALAISDGCTSGELRPMGGVGDVIDLYTFDGAAGQQIVYTLGAASALATMSLRAADGSWSVAPISTNGLANVTLPADGKYEFAVAQSSGTMPVPYVIAMNGDDPGQSSCRPMCLTAATG